MFPGEKVGIFSSSYRQAKFVFAEVERISISNFESVAKKPTKNGGRTSLSTGNKPVVRFPLGEMVDHSWSPVTLQLYVMRPLRFHLEIFDVVVRG